MIMNFNCIPVTSDVNSVSRIKIFPHIVNDLVESLLPLVHKLVIEEIVKKSLVHQDVFLQLFIH